MIKQIIYSIRPKQLFKNLVIFIPLIFSQNFFNLELFYKSAVGFISFSLLSGAVYILNDVMDAERDKSHPVKSKRPIASGALGIRAAILSFTVLVIAALAVSFQINILFGLASVAYLAVQVGYSFYFKHVVIMDIFSIASGFFLRVIAGAAAIQVPASSWLLVCTFFLSLFLALGKRRHELLLLEGDAASHRKVLTEYNTILIDQMIAVVTASAVVTYSVYTLSQETVSRFQTTNLKYTIPFVLYGIYRYLYFVYLKREGGSPEVILFTDLPMIINLFLYMITVIIILYMAAGV